MTVGGPFTDDHTSIGRRVHTNEDAGDNYFVNKSRANTRAQVSAVWLAEFSIFW